MFGRDRTQPESASEQEQIAQLSETSDISAKQDKSAVVARYDTHLEAEQAVRELHRSGFDMRKLSIVGKNY